MVIELSTLNVLRDPPSAYSTYILVGIESSTCHVTWFLNAVYSTRILQAIELPTREVLRASPAAISTHILLGIWTSTYSVIFISLFCFYHSSFNGHGAVNRQYIKILIFCPYYLDTGWKRYLGINHAWQEFRSEQKDVYREKSTSCILKSPIRLYIQFNLFINEIFTWLFDRL